MDIVATRTRIGMDQPTYAYRLYVPMSQLSPERQRLIAYRSNFGIGARDAYLARVDDVIAPMTHLETPPGPVRYAQAKAIEEAASRLSAIILCALFPEMTADMLPFRFTVLSAPPNAIVHATVHELTSRYEALQPLLATITSALIGVRIDRRVT
ncbi:hypothetical protein AWL63_23430 (plasmid) [Sphingomonas panacis]|uniref:Uncharacterized protein n=1 Tax=Sphingomonas panacis TaxID=1560345 RepID=A0A1B3ZI71_9SPHN|nr:hypothetical protein [Sphingomonas panacis]AOH87129.1 hypothetical protein AWL63_23430 [Sphingomonas panacis]